MKNFVNASLKNEKKNKRELLPNKRNKDSSNLKSINRGDKKRRSN